jgi:digeranylgeranylglycerophospholipid reductase
MPRGWTLPILEGIRPAPACDCGTMLIDPTYDVLVVGAGPAGARTAEVLSRRGLSVALVERDPEPGLPAHCTGIVSAECFEHYAMPESLIIKSIRSFVLRSPSGRGAKVKRKTTQAYVLDRPAMDRWFVERATDEGAVLMASTTVTALAWNGAGVEGRAEREGETFKIRARAAVVATGFGGKLPRQVGLGAPGDLLSGCQVVVEADGIDELEVLTGQAYGDGGFGWLLPWKPGLALAGLMTRRGTMNHLGDLVGRLQNEGRVGAVQEVFRLRAIPVGASGHTVADGIVGVGDAMGLVKPTSGGGIYFGLLSADLAAPVLADAIEAGDLSAVRLSAYERQWRDLLDAEIRQGVALRGLIEKLPDALVEQMHRLLSVPGLRRLLVRAAPSFDWHSGPLTRFLAKLQHSTDESAARVG